ncbi:hypothetical protein [Oceanirhabdus sp. W0125-5]|uniref:hypothetical protein n=1 Tax=Oceanirhabdus sp. W0125-5 TaxID=2999116 RepID=UPI0022F2C17F|nr:hypothetical protein [Oceanirhabdus sp. W0125-5]WBW99484.1 hypothetical protein OW730_12270 [Oceanirhabdus sp. W0125-5]
MDKICADVIRTVYGYDELSIVVNGMSLDVYLSEKTGLSKLKELYPAWGNSLLCKNESKFIWELLDNQKETLNIPILLCPEDLDLSCIVLVSKTTFSDNRVCWDKIGCILKDNYDVKKEVQSGILDVESWSDEDLEKYAGSLAWCNIDDIEWKLWVSENWDEEKMRRLYNYTYKYYQNDENIEWYETPKLEFLKEDYLKCLERFRKEL